MAKSVNVAAKLDGTSVDLLNTIRSEAGGRYLQEVPLATKDNLKEIAAILKGDAGFPNLKDMFVNTLFIKVGMQIVNRFSFNNPLGVYKRNTDNLANVIEEIYIGLVKENQFNPVIAETELYKQELPKIAAQYHVRNRKSFYKVTISSQMIAEAFQTVATLDSFINQVIGTLITSNEFDEYLYIKSVLEAITTEGSAKVVEVGDNYSDLLVALQEKSDDMEFIQKWNAAGVPNSDAQGEISFALSNKVNAKLNVEELAAAFNLSKAEYVGKRVKVDKFTDPRVLGIMYSDYLPVVTESLREANVAYNPQGIYQNHFLHIWQTISASRFQNAVVFVTEATPDELVRMYVEPFTDIFTRMTDERSYDVEYEADYTIKEITELTATENSGNYTITVDPEFKKITVKPAKFVRADSQIITLTATVVFDKNGVDTTATITRDFVIGQSEYMVNNA